MRNEPSTSFPHRRESPKKGHLSTQRIVLLVVAVLLSTPSFAQEETNYTWQTFRDTRIVNGHSVESGQQGEMKMIISHRFGALNSGAYELYGLDQATIRYGLDYAITNNLDVGVGRSSFQKTFDGYVKYKFRSQSSGARNMPISATFLQGFSWYGLKWQNPEFPFPLTNRLTYFSQLIVARKFSPKFSLQVSPTYVHRNYVANRQITNDLAFVGISSRVQVTKVTAVLMEFFPKVYGTLATGRGSSFSLGAEFQTKAHVFQLHLSNSSGMVESLFLTETTGSWSDLGIMIGFNITRDFKVGKRRF
ncbi:MAG: DUF5777 family beta-barrel protein [Cyclobacteriaceae bacterium]